MALFCAKFACILAISNLVFRWESRKGSVWESVKKWSSLYKVAGTCDWTSRVARDLQAARSCTCSKHAENLKHHASWRTIGQKVQTGHSVSLWLELVSQSSRKAKPPASSILEKLILRIPNTHRYKYFSYLGNIESF